ncbi:unnamed protein product [Closterium sp. Naga37s-1]|nr:unnamed protein product [Closterium sp. Naga37s-1]
MRGRAFGTEPGGWSSKARVNGCRDGGGDGPAERTEEAIIEDNRAGSVLASTPNRRKPLVWVEPVALSLKRDRKGLGKEEEEAEAERQKLLRAEAAARVRRRGEGALRGEFEERRKGRWSEWKVRGALRKARTALVHLEGGEEWLKAQAVRIGAASSSSSGASAAAAAAAAAASGGAHMKAKRLLPACAQGKTRTLTDGKEQARMVKNVKKWCSRAGPSLHPPLLSGS